MKARTSLFLAVLLWTATSLFGQDLASFEKRVTVHKLPNGLTVVLCQRHEAPVFSFNLFVDAGSAQDPTGQDRHRAHDGAHGVQGNADHRHQELRERKTCSRRGREGLRRLPAGEAQARPSRSAGACEAGSSLEEGRRRRQPVRDRQRIRRDRGARRWRRYERRYRRRRDPVLLLDADQPAGAVGLHRV